MAYIIFLIFLIRDQTPTVTWFFYSESCVACQLQQLEMMRDLYREGDKVILFITSDNVDKHETVTRVHDFFPDLKIEVKSAEPICQLTTGWHWEDPSTGEEIIYNSKLGTYSAFRSRSLLKLMR